MNTLGTMKVLLVSVAFDCRVVMQKPPVNVKNKAGYTATQVACGWAGAVTKAIALGLEFGILALRWDLGLKTGIRASKLGYGPRG